MALKKSHGNMYDWVTHMHSHLAGECPHRCGYCYVQTNPHGVSPRWKGEIRLVEDELGTDYGSDKTIFIEHMGDLFADEVPADWIEWILSHCKKYPDNIYVFQTKNPARASLFLLKPSSILKFMMGTTIETNRIYKDTLAPKSIERYKGILSFSSCEIKTFVTIEPIMDFDLDVLLGWILDINPTFINIGADSKRCNLPEPTPFKIKDFILKLQSNGIHIKKKTNLKRLLQ